MITIDLEDSIDAKIDSRIETWNREYSNPEKWYKLSKNYIMCKKKQQQVFVVRSSSHGVVISLDWKILTAKTYEDYYEFEILIFVPQVSKIICQFKMEIYKNEMPSQLK